MNPKVEKEKLFLRYILPTATVKKRKEKEKAVGKDVNNHKPKEKRNHKCNTIKKRCKIMS